MAKKEKRRALSYKEKKLNSMNRLQLLEALFYVPYSPGFVSDKILELMSHKMSIAKSKEIAKNVNARFLTALSKEPKYANFINSIWELKKEFNRKPHPFNNLDGIAVMCYVLTKVKAHKKTGGYNTEDLREGFFVEALAMWMKGGESWNELIDYYYNVNDEVLGTSTEA